MQMSFLPRRSAGEELLCFLIGCNPAVIVRKDYSDNIVGLVAFMDDGSTITINYHKSAHWQPTIVEGPAERTPQELCGKIIYRRSAG